ncbi:alkyl hydroperoxide reductase/ Thiol specific antioxidant/ Mal allergen [mine drainage metagenome]|uniref:Alkyl hydroperoxide reductase/ Thiol specific antioxidant/ Mal allergen n=1 Tax=mine drainage metagenome TaxID=410659 RepID=T1B3A8_9ZZZZ
MMNPRPSLKPTEPPVPRYFFLFDRHHQLVYRGQFDGSRPKNAEPVTGKDLITALEAVLIDAPQVTDQFPSLGCNIKWKEGNEPDYF